MSEPTGSGRDGVARYGETVRLSADGIAKVLGDLEARVMRAIWGIGAPATARMVHERVREEHAVALHTVITVLNKLVGKGLLRREKRLEILHYEACQGEEEFVEQASRRLVEGILSLAPDAVAASFVNVLAARDPERLGELMRLIRERLERGEG